MHNWTYTIEIRIRILTIEQIEEIGARRKTVNVLNAKILFFTINSGYCFRQLFKTCLSLSYVVSQSIKNAFLVIYLIMKYFD